MTRAAVFATTLALQGCALLPADSLVGVYWRIGPDTAKSMNLEWSNERRDPTWRCPTDAPVLGAGVPTWMQCDSWPVLKP